MDILCTSNATINEEHTEIMDRIPNELSRIGVVLLICIVTIMIVLGYLVHYPDSLSGKATLNSINPAVNLVMPSNGKIVLLAKAKDTVSENEIVAIVENTADYKYLCFLQSQLADFLSMKECDYDSLWRNLPLNANIGDIKIPYIKFLMSLKTRINNNNNHMLVHEIEKLNNKVDITKSNIQEKESILSAMKERVLYSRMGYQRDSLLWAQEVLSSTDFENSKSIFLQQKIQYKQSLIDVEGEKQTIRVTRSEIEKLKLEQAKINHEEQDALIDSYMELMVSMDAWIKANVIKSPIAGVIEYMRFINTNQYIEMNTVLFRVMPTAETSSVEVVLPTNGVGKIKIGQRAIIKLVDYPAQEYGDINGKVEEISFGKTIVDKEDMSLIRVKLDNLGQTSYGKTICLYSGMPAYVDIITEDKRFISRLFEPLKYISKK